MQLPLYTLWRTGTPGEIAFALIHCTGGDILITAVTLAAAAALARLFCWRPFGWRMVSTAIALGAAYTMFSEWLNVEIRRTWAYAATMPVIPWLGTGLAPLLQWLVVPPWPLPSPPTNTAEQPGGYVDGAPASPSVRAVLCRIPVLSNFPRRSVIVP